jgi:hypothetical protein
VSERERQLSAERGGFFWLPCPKCGEFFGGNERSAGTVRSSVDASTRSLTCANCPGDWLVQFVELDSGS